MIVRRFEYDDAFKTLSDLSVPLHCCGMELAPCIACAKQVAKASLGHYPLPFLISKLKNWNKSKRGFLYNQTFAIKIL